MPVYSNARFNMALFQQKEADRKSDKSPHATGSLEIDVNDIEEFFGLIRALEPVDNWDQTRKVVKLRCGVWHRETRAGKPWESIAVSPERGADFKEEALTQPHTKEVPLAAVTVVGDDEEI